mmetsp:Transcript_52243/g.138487  ORF Transcript_52243/g.138487 Transcript_52243/m.138487 type:complete len:205 (+) Transcript_52243:1968-2582(+)
MGVMKRQLAKNDRLQPLLLGGDQQVRMHLIGVGHVHGIHMLHEPDSCLLNQRHPRPLLIKRGHLDLFPTLMKRQSHHLSVSQLGCGLARRADRRDVAAVLPGALGYAIKRSCSFGHQSNLSRHPRILLVHFLQHLLKLPRTQPSAQPLPGLVPVQQGLEDAAPLLPRALQGEGREPGPEPRGGDRCGGLPGAPHSLAAWAEIAD